MTNDDRVFLLRVALVPLPVALGFLAMLIMRRIDQGEWDLSSPVILMAITFVLILPGVVVAIKMVHAWRFYLLALLLLPISVVLGLVAVAADDGAQAGINIYLTPILSVASGGAVVFAESTWGEAGRRSPSS